MFRVALRNEGQKGQRDRKCRAGMAMPEQLQTCLLIWQNLGWRIEGRKNLGQGINRGSQRLGLRISPETHFEHPNVQS